MKNSLIFDDVSYTFSDYLVLINYVEDILSHFGYSFQRQECKFPHSTQKLERLNDIKSCLKGSLPYISMSSEAARREFLIAPILMDVVFYTQAQLKVDFSLTVSEQLKGIIDYYLESKANSFIITEAKKGEIDKAFIQLAVELIAFDQGLENQTQQLYGAVSMGNIWQFGLLDRKTKVFTQDLNLLRVPADLQELLEIIVGILEK